MGFEIRKRDGWKLEYASYFGLADEAPAYEGKVALGGKGDGLREMAALGVPVPPGFTIVTQMCLDYRTKPKGTLVQLGRQLKRGMATLKKVGGFDPLVSVRSGAQVSMPGMMDTVLNVGLTKARMPEWEKRIGRRAMLDCRRRLLAMFGNVVAGIPSEMFEAALGATKAGAGAEHDSELDCGHLETLCGLYEKVYENETGTKFPETRDEQLLQAAEAVLRSWDNPRAVKYRELNEIPHDWGTAVNICSMVFGNADDESSSGVLFTRDPATGENQLVGEWLLNAQGEDVVSGVRTPRPLADIESGLRAALGELAAKLEEHYGDAQDIEFTVESGKLWILQTRSAKRTPQAAFRIARDMVNDGMLTRTQALARVTSGQFAQIRRPMIAAGFDEAPIATGIPGCPGIVTGRPVFSSEAAADATDPVILVTPETSPDDLPGMDAAIGVLTQRGGTTSHAAVVARSMNKPCVVGAPDVVALAKECEEITIDGSTGRVWPGAVPTTGGAYTESVEEMLRWAYEALAAIPKGPDLMSDRQRVTALRWVNGQGTAAIEAVERLTDRSGIVFDLTAQEAPRVEEDEVLWSLFGEDAPDSFPYDAAGDAAKALSEAKLEGAVIYLPPELREGWVENLKAAGYKIAADCRTVADLLDSDGYVNVDQEFIETICGGPTAYAKLTEVCAKVGMTFKSVPDGLEAHEVAARVFGKEM